MLHIVNNHVPVLDRLNSNIITISLLFYMMMMMMMMMSVCTRRRDVCYNDLWVSLFQVFYDRVFTFRPTTLRYIQLGFLKAIPQVTCD
jgi:hypothetical protein